MSRTVTEQDLRRPEFREGTPEDYMFDRNGKIVPKVGKGASFIGNLVKRAENHLSELEEVKSESYAKEESEESWYKVKTITEALMAMRALQTSGVRRFNVKLDDGSTVNGLKIQGLNLVTRQKGRPVAVSLSNVVSWTPAKAKPWYHFGF